MLVGIGSVVVVVMVFGGYMAMGGKMAVLFQPFELVIIGGAALGAFITSNTKTILKDSGKGIGRVAKGPKHGKDGYMEILSLLYQIFKLARSKGNLAIEKHIEEPEESELFANYPKILADHHVMQFLCDYLRLLTMGSENPHELEALMDQDLDAHHKEELAVASAYQSMADGMPALGIVAAAGILAHIAGHPPAISVEFARKTLSTDVRPGFSELEESFESLPPVAA